MTVAAVRSRLEPLLLDGLVATCAIIDLELGYSARNAQTHQALRRERRAMPRIPLDEAVFDRAIEVQGLLAVRGEQRLPIPDLVLAAAAEQADISVLHYEADFERISSVTGQPHVWVVPRGSVP
jgi:predicted nucleic acid-binding protein